MGQDIRDILVSFDSGLIYRHVSESFETRPQQVKIVEDETNVPFTLSFSSCLMLSRRECKPGIIFQTRQSLGPLVPLLGEIDIYTPDFFIENLILNKFHLEHFLL